MTIRNYEPDDLEHCRALWAEMTQRHRDIYDDQSIGGDNPGLEFDQHLSLVGPELTWVATSKDAVIGMASLAVNGEQAEIEPIVVSSNHRGKGIGLALLNHVTEQAKNLGVICLSVKPVARNEDAISYFHHAGFKTLGHIQLFKWLGPDAPEQWKSGPKIFGKSFFY